ncbi:MAG: ATP-binding cassette domain-containing protein [Candidatus Latescibacterota bacterium]|nr:ATP-binding cassette domain-containing protein [Candidatus Latescibacterota bacterium]
MSLLNLRQLHIAFGGPPILAGVDLRVERADRLCLVGRNGEGKSTLMKIISGEIQPDSGEQILEQQAHVARLDQDVPDGISGTVLDIARQGLRSGDPPHRADIAVTRLQLDPHANFTHLSGGLRRRVLLARALSAQPDLLLLDEPTNHLDLDSILYLEDFLLRWDGTLIFVSHDRAFVRRLATRIAEIDRGQLHLHTGSYDDFIRNRDARLAIEETQAAVSDARLGEEEKWVRQSISARRTRNEGRVRALQKMREERQQRQQRQGTSRLRVQEAERSGDLVIEAEDLYFAYSEGLPQVSQFSLLVGRGDKIGIVGPNGSGKTTLLHMLLGQLEPQRGSVRHGTRLQIAHFDQLRAQLNLDESVAENIAPGQEYLDINGQRRHVYGYLQDFLFTPARARTPVGALSGGERNRLLLARLFAKPANLLVLDEPTNDLDTETLELLEEQLVHYSGTLLIVSHDRAFLDNVVTSLLVFEGDGQIGEYAGGYSDWLARHQSAQTPRTAENKKARKQQRSKQRKRKLSFNEQRELNALPDQIEALEAEQSALHEQMADPAFYQQNGEDVTAAQTRLEQIDNDLKRAYARWEELGEIAEAQ